jgi:hypothetical protein
MPSDTYIGVPSNMKRNITFIQPAIITLAIIGGVVAGGIVIFAIASDFPGIINLRFGADGIQLHIDGGRNRP